MKKRVRWDDSVEDNEAKPKLKRRKLTDNQSKKGRRYPKLSIAMVEKCFERNAYEELEAILSQYPEPIIIKLFSQNDYQLFGQAAVKHNVDALNFIIKKFPELSWHMLSSSNVSAFRCFLYHTCTLAELEKLNEQKRIECFKIFLKMDRELVEEAFHSFYSKLVEEDVAKQGLKRDFDKALSDVDMVVVNEDAEEKSAEYDDDHEGELGMHTSRYASEGANQFIGR
ncbi:MAG: hypothetical protein LW825_02660 [Candidatus Jidaibacter sp.]|nr:hypothetical protein [Candidatus Jidaibacter sp.]